MDSRARAVAAIAQGARPAAVVPAGAAAATELSRLKKQLHELEEKRDNVIKKRRSRREARPPSCWAACGRRGGACPQFCGEGGACCKLAWVSDGRDPNACPAEMAEFRYHTCVAQSFVGVTKGDPAMTDFSISSAGVHLGRTNLVREPGYTRPTMDDYYAFADGTSALPAAIERHLSDRGRAGKTPWPDAQQQAPKVPKDRWRCNRSFAVGKRGVMRPLFTRLRLCEPETRSTAVHVWWTETMELETKFWPPRRPASRAGFPEGGSGDFPEGADRQLWVIEVMIVAQVPGLVQLIGVKPALGRLQEVCYRKTGYSRLSPPANADAEHCGFTKRSFTGQLESVAADFRSYNLNTMRHYRPSGGGALRHRLWICKPRGGFNSELSSEDTTLAWLTRRVPAGEYVMQDFEMNPMTFAGHKFDLRRRPPDADVELGTLREIIPPRERANGAKLVYPTSTTDEYWFSNVRPQGREFWTRVAWPSVEKAIVLLLAREQIIHADHKLKRHGRILFLSPDVVIDERGNATMVEINVNGYMIGNLHKEYFPIQPQQDAVGSFTGIAGFPLQRHYSAELQRRTASFCRGMVHEQMHSSHEWYRLFPRPKSSPLHAAFRTAAFKDSLTPLDKLAVRWLSQSDWLPEHSTNRTTGVVSINGESAIPRLAGRPGLGLRHGK
ncbi:hypothetical protein EMIHUDRAFT_460024 [Emiliania huxleyi CCMP1516]|uniref:Uncharacterized protein n=2 Tax=Emiliania huxleyi TaxID=2903 RepID=A0A0D3I9C4_EMIH1|nr:hypothetical protein EMIHUDRAFT_460024 [Emiliania huxleyi CCMP1516]EOD07859.1 hypothetical protein EMIHUDRAFT_460024 [Emiliania huxleyi CCMP1516]|eukprot:XP_005760288.1 hypothetical protein EMIHUDRAFT_460024 [Emiliania huxleyi CCMP1516]